MEFVNQPPIDPNSEENKHLNPVLAQIYNFQVGQHGVPIVICRKHYAEMKRRLAVNAPECVLSIIALIPVTQNCNICVGNAYERAQKGQ